MALQHVRQLQHRASELFESIAGFVVEADLYKHQQTTLEVLRVKPGVVAHDDPFALQSANPLGTGRGRQTDLFPSSVKEMRPSACRIRRMLRSILSSSRLV